MRQDPPLGGAGASDEPDFQRLVDEISGLIRDARRDAARAVHRIAQEVDPESVAGLPEPDDFRAPHLLRLMGLNDDLTGTTRHEYALRRLEAALLNLDSGFCVVTRRQRFRVGSRWSQFDLLLFDRSSRRLVVLGLGLGGASRSVVDRVLLGVHQAEEMRLPGEADPLGIAIELSREVETVTLLPDRLHEVAKERLPEVSFFLRVVLRALADHKKYAKDTGARR